MEVLGCVFGLVPQNDESRDIERCDLMVVNLVQTSTLRNYFVSPFFFVSDVHRGGCVVVLPGALKNSRVLAASSVV